MAQSKKYDPAKFDWWKEKLAGGDVPLHANEPMQGYYALKRTKASAPVPVAIWWRDGRALCKIGTEMGNALEIWVSVMRSPIPYAVYQSVIGGAPWPHEIRIVAADGSEDSTLSNAKSEDEALLGNVKEWMAQAEKARKKGAPQSQHEADSLSDIAGKLSDYCSEADNYRERLIAPHLAAQREVNNKYLPVLKSGKALVTNLKALVGIWLTAERDRLAAEAKENAARLAEATPPSPDGSGQDAAHEQAIKVPTPRAGTRKTVGMIKRSFVVFVDTDETKGIALAMNYLANLERIPPDVVTAVERAVFALIDAGISVPGAKIETREVPR